VSIHFACPICRTEYRVDDDRAGKRTECKKCGQRLQVPTPERKTVLAELLPAPTPQPSPAPSEPMPVVRYRQPRPEVAERDDDDRPRRRRRVRRVYVDVGFRCVYCNTSDWPLERSKVSTAGWIFFWVFLLFLCFPLCWIGLFFKEDYRVCSRCGMRIG
jgi:predicted Zn finger-like uncharacterized protein